MQRLDYPCRVRWGSQAGLQSHPVGEAQLPFLWESSCNFDSVSSELLQPWQLESYFLVHEGQASCLWNHGPAPPSSWGSVLSSVVRAGMCSLEWSPHLSSLPWRLRGFLSCRIQAREGLFDLCTLASGPPLSSTQSKQERKKEMKERAGICRTKIKHKYSSNTTDRAKRQIGEIFAKMINLRMNLLGKEDGQ